MNATSRRVWAGVCGATVAVVAASAAGQAPANGKPDAANPLAGPKVGAESASAAKPATLVQRDFDGKVTRLEVSPPEAALRLLKLGAETKAKTDAVIAKRNAALDSVVRDNLRLLVELAGANQAGKREDSARLLRELMEKAAPLREMGTLQTQLAKVLPENERQEMTRLVTEYWAAVTAESQANAGEGMKESESDAMKDEDAKSGGAATGERGRTREGRGGMAQPLRREFLAMIGQEVRRSYVRVVGQQAADFDALIKSLNLSEAQESKVRQIVGDSFQKYEGKIPAQERAKLVSLVWRELDGSQREILLKRLRPE